MAPLPKTALKHRKLTPLSAGSAVPKSGHEVIQVEFIDYDGQKKKAFFKQLDHSYPEILAKISVATSVILRMSLGNRAAEERLVYDDKGEIFGTLSIAMEGFKPFNSSNESVPDDPQKKEEVVPSCGTLMQHNVMEVLFFSWFLGDDDLHPKNIGLKGRIDYDMFFYCITKIIKGPRQIAITTGDKLELSSKDFANFPILQDETCTYWPTRHLPGNFNVPRRYANVEEFTELAKNPIYNDIKTNKNISAQEQLFTASLKALLTYQPEVLEKKLKDALGTTPLNYTALPPDKQRELESKFSNFFNLDKNAQPFTEFMMTLYHNYYDELYRKVVFFKGCEKNTAGAAVPPFHQFLTHHPSAYHQLSEWAKEQNKNLSDQQKLAHAYLSQHGQETDTQAACVDTLPRAVKASSDKRRFEMDDFEHRYHQIWRDSFSLVIKDILYKARKVSEELQQHQSLEHQAHVNAGKNPDDQSVTQAWELLDTLKEDSIDEVEGRLSSYRDSEQRQGLINFVQLYKQLFQATKAYFQVDIKDLSILENSKYLESLRPLPDQFYDIEQRYFGRGTSWGIACREIGNSLDEFCNTIRFTTHLNKNDARINGGYTQEIVVHTSKHTDQLVVDNCLEALFNWVKKIPATEFERLINETIDSREYNGSFYTRADQRGPCVKSFLSTNQKMTGDDRLAFILASGDSDGKTLNILLVKNLIHKMLSATQSDIQVHLPSVKTAFDEGNFDANFYTKKAINHAKSNDRFNHLYSKNAVNQINRTLYQWIDDIPSKQFTSCINVALAQYESKISYFTFYGKGSRRPEVTQLLRNESLSHSEILKQIFITGGVESTSLNTYLFEEIRSAMHADIMSDNDKLMQDNYKLILQLSSNDTAFFMPLIQDYAQRNLIEQNTSSADSRTERLTQPA